MLTVDSEELIYSQVFYRLGLQEQLSNACVDTKNDDMQQKLTKLQS